MRTYPFQLPAHLSHFIASFAPSRLQDAGIWNNFPVDFRKKIQYSANTWGASLDITQEDLDSLDDATWDKLYQLISPYLDHVDTPPVTNMPKRTLDDSATGDPTYVDLLSDSDRYDLNHPEGQG